MVGRLVAFLFVARRCRLYRLADRRSSCCGILDRRFVAVQVGGLCANDSSSAGPDIGEPHGADPLRDGDTISMNGGGVSPDTLAGLDLGNCDDPDFGVVEVGFLRLLR